MRPIRFSSSKNVLYICLTQPGLCFLMVSSTCFPLSSNFFSSLSTSSRPSWISCAINNLILVDCLYSVTGLSGSCFFPPKPLQFSTFCRRSQIYSVFCVNKPGEKVKLMQDNFHSLRVQSNPYQLQCCQK